MGAALIEVTRSSITSNRGVRLVSMPYYMTSRTHLALAKDSPLPRPVQPPSTGQVVATAEVGGLHHRYDRVAA